MIHNERQLSETCNQMMEEKDKTFMKQVAERIRDLYYSEDAENAGNIENIENIEIPKDIDDKIIEFIKNLKF